MSRWLITAEENDISKLSKAWENFYNLLSTTDDTVPGIQEVLGIQPNKYDEEEYKRVLNEAYTLLNKLDEKNPEYHDTYVKLMNASEIPSISNL